MTGAMLAMAMGIIVTLTSPGVLSVATTGSASGWGIPVVLETSPEWAMYPRIAVGANGEAIAVWTQRSPPPDPFSPPGDGDVWASRYVPSVGWLPAEGFGFVPGNAPDPRVAVDAAGNAMAVWTEVEQGGGRATIWTNRYVVGGGWEGVRLLADGNASAPDVGIEATGVAIVAWAVWYGGLDYQIFASRFVPGSGWEAAVPLASRGATGPPYVAVDQSGTAVVVWSQSPDILANLYTPGQGWGSAVAITPGILGETWAPKVASAGNGSFVAAWHQEEGAPVRIWANRYDPATGWAAAERIGTGTSGLGAWERVHVAAGDDGLAMAAWEQGTDTRHAIFANLFLPGIGWGTEARIDTDAGGSLFPRVAVDRRGNGIVAWQQGGNVYANRYTVGGGWSGPELVETRSGSAESPDIGVDGEGNAIAVWMQYDVQSGYDTWATRYLVPDTTPPQLVITSPTDGATTNESTITVAGMTEPDATLVVNGVVAFVEADGRFSLDIALRPGTNLILATAIDHAGNEANETVRVRYEDPVSGVPQDLEEALQMLREARSSLDALRLLAVVGLTSVIVAVGLLEIVRYYRQRRKRIRYMDSNGRRET